jgi:hypothetical protein
VFTTAVICSTYERVLQLGALIRRQLDAKQICREFLTAGSMLVSD